MAKKGLLDRKIQGAIKPEEKFEEVASGIGEKENISVEENRTARLKKSFKNQKATIKLSSETKKDLDVLKSMEKIKFDYEIIQLLADAYVRNLSTEDQRRFTVLRENS